MTSHARILIPLLLLLPAVLSGCVGDEAGGPTAQEPAPQDAHRATQGAAGPAAAAAPPPRLAIERELEQGVSVGIPCPTRVGETDCAAGNLRSQRFDIPYGRPARAVLTATWDAQTDVSQTLRITFRQNVEGASEHTVASRSPLTLEIPPGAIPEPGEYKVLVRPETPGATANEVVRYVVTLEYG